MNYLVNVSAKLKAKSFTSTLPDMRIEAGSAATAAHRALLAASKTDMVKRKRVDYWQVRVTPLL